MSNKKVYFFNLLTHAYLNLIFFCNCQPQTCSFGSKPCTQLLIQHHFKKYPQEPNWIYDFHRLLKTFEDLKPWTILSQTFGTKVIRRFFKTQPSKRRFSKFLNMKLPWTKLFIHFSKVGTFVPNDGSPMSSRLYR